MFRYLGIYYGSAAEIHASQEVLMESVGKGLSPPTARICIYRPPAITIGYFQDVFEEVNVKEARRLGLDIMRRPTAGGTVLMKGPEGSEDVPGWEIWVHEKFKGLPDDIEERYYYLTLPMIEVLNKLGIDAKFRAKNDIEVKGRKIAGVGECVINNGLLHTGTLLIDFDIPTMLKVLRIVPEKISDKHIKIVSERITTIKRELGYKPSLREISNLFKKALKYYFNTNIGKGELTSWETSRLKEIIKRYSSYEWTFKNIVPKTYSWSYIKKTRAGLFRIYVKIEDEKTINSVIISGDFFIHPRRTIYDLEAKLKWRKLEKNEVYAIVKEVFQEHNAKILGIGVEDFFKVLWNALTLKAERE